MTTYRTLREANVARQKEYKAAGDAPISLSFWGLALAGEVGEACNVMKKLERERLGMAGSRTDKGRLAQELADIAIYLDLIALVEGINLDEAVEHKFNRTSRELGFSTYYLPQQGAHPSEYQS